MNSSVKMRTFNKKSKPIHVLMNKVNYSVQFTLKCAEASESLLSVCWDAAPITAPAVGCRAMAGLADWLPLLPEADGGGMPDLGEGTLWLVDLRDSMDLMRVSGPGG